MAERGHVKLILAAKLMANLLSDIVYFNPQSLKLETIANWPILLGYFGAIQTYGTVWRTSRSASLERWID